MPVSRETPHAYCTSPSGRSKRVSSLPPSVPWSSGVQRRTRNAVMQETPRHHSCRPWTIATLLHTTQRSAEIERWNGGDAALQPAAGVKCWNGKVQRDSSDVRSSDVRSSDVGNESNAEPKGQVDSSSEVLLNQGRVERKGSMLEFAAATEEPLTTQPTSFGSTVLSPFHVKHRNGACGLTWFLNACGSYRDTEAV